MTVEDGREILAKIMELRKEEAQIPTETVRVMFEDKTVVEISDVIRVGYNEVGDYFVLDIKDRRNVILPADKVNMIGSAEDVPTDVDEIKATLKERLENNQEGRVVYIPKYIIEKWLEV